jgi:hypothetical protein
MVAAKYTVLAQSPYPGELFAGSPSLARLPHGRLVASHEWFTGKLPKKKAFDHTEIQISDDDGATWRPTATLKVNWASIFTLEEDLYAIGVQRVSRGICIAHSADGGETWSETVTLFEGHYHGAPTSVLVREDFVYRAFENGARTPPEWGSCVVAGDLSRGLLEPDAWRMSNSVAFPDVPDVLTQHRYPPGPGVQAPPDSWLEGNVIDVRGEMRVLLRARIDGMSTANLAGVCALEDDGRKMRYRFLQFYPMPGGQCKFHIVHDAAGGLFWTTVTIPTDTWQDPEPLRELGFRGPPGNERRILILMYSLDALNWFQAGCVAMDRHPCHAFSYTSQLVDGDDLLILARTSQGGRNQHDTNMITLHRVQGFRDLAVDLTPSLEQRKLAFNAKT